MRKLFNTTALLLICLLAPSVAHAGMRMTLFAINSKAIAEAKKDPRKLEAFIETEGPHSLDIDKSWHGIHYLLTGNASKPEAGIGQIILGGKEIGEDQGYGPAHYFTAEEVKELAVLLKKETPEKLAARYNPMAMQKADIYPEIWVRDDKEALEYLLEYYKRIVDFYARAAKHNQAILFVIN
jgi:hypothetical protein